MRILRLAVLAVVSSLMAACGQPSAQNATSPPGQNATSPSAQNATSPSASATPSSSTPSPSASASFPVAADVTCPDLSSYGLTRYLERPTDSNRREAVFCDSRQLDRPLALHELDAGQTVGFISNNLIGYLQQSGNGPTDASGAIKTFDLQNHAVKTVATSPGGFVGVAAWSHDQSMLAFTTDNGSDHRFWFKRGDSPISQLTSPIQLFGRDGIEGDETLVAFSPDDQYVLFVDTAVYRLQIFRTSDGSVAYTAPSGPGGLRTMATWAHKSDQMYFRNNSGIYRWDPATGISSFAPGVKWENPLFSPDDSHLVYTVWDSSGMAQIVNRDMTSGTTTRLATWRITHEFLSTPVLLVGVTQPCDNQGPCGPFAYTGETRTLRLDTRAEGQLPMPNGWGLDAYVTGS